MNTTAYTPHLPTALYTAAQVRELDRLAIAAGTPGYTLMTRAGQAAFDCVREHWPTVRRVVVFCGSGNNGGDGYVVARLARQQGMDVRLFAVSDPLKLQGDARLAWQDACAAGVTPEALGADFVLQDLDPQRAADTVCVDAVLGTGLQGDVRGAAAHAIALMNHMCAPVLAIDLPSGLCADTGRVWGEAVRAAVTITFIGMKPGLLTGAGPAHAGKCLFAALEVDASRQSAVLPMMQRVSGPWVRSLLGARPRDAHKGWYGHVLVVGGDHGMGGAALMAAEAAARSGAGLVSLATRAEHVPAVLARRPEIMVHPLGDDANISALLTRASVIVAGPGLGQGAWGQSLLRQVLAANTPVVLDADALNGLAALAASGVFPARNEQQIRVMTPHPGEAARMLQTSTITIQQDRPAAAQALQKQFGGVVILKGAGTLICAEDTPLRLAAVGNPGMASGGMGDVLSGVTGGLLAQHLAPAEAAAAAVWLHGKAADAAALEGERGMLATDLLLHLRHLVNGKTDLHY